MADHPKTDKTDLPASTPKKPYRAPELLEWGSMRDITLASGSSGGPDGAKKGSTKTH